MNFCMVTDNRITVPRRLPPVIRWLGDEIETRGLTPADLRDLGVYPYRAPDFDPVTQREGRLVLVADPAGDFVTREVQDALPEYQKHRAEKEIARIDAQAARWVLGLVKLLVEKEIVAPGDIPAQIRDDYQRRQALIEILNT